MQGFGDESYSKEELVDEPVLDLGREFQLSQNETDINKDSMEMHEFLKPTVQDLGEEREMLVDEVYELDLDYYSYATPDVQEVAPLTETDFDTTRQCAKKLEPTEVSEVSPSLTTWIYDKKKRILKS